jgi:LacI family transcriptional regulator
VFLDCIPGIDFNTINGDLLLIEGKSTVESMVSHVISKGARDVSFIGDIKYAQTNKERYLGYVSAMTRNNLPIYIERNLTGPIGIETYEEEITAFLSGMSRLPDAIICANDYIAKIVLQFLKKSNIRVPEDIMLTGFDDNPESGNDVAFTTVHVQNDLIGIRLAKQLIYHLDNPDADYEITYIRSRVLFRESTDG